MDFKKSTRLDTTNTGLSGAQSTMEQVRFVAGIVSSRGHRRQCDEWPGLTSPPRRWPPWLLTTLAVVLAVAFLFFGHYTRRGTVIGQLVPSAGLLNIPAPSAGMLRATCVGVMSCFATSPV